MNNVMLVVTASSALLVSLLVVVSNRTRATNRSIFGFSLSIFMWLLLTLLTNLSASASTSMIFAKFSLIGPLFAAYFFIVFVVLFVGSRKVTFKWLAFVALPLIPVLLLVPSSYNIISIGERGSDTEVGLLYLYAVPIIFIYGILGVIKLIKFRMKQVDPVVRTQVNYILLGIILFIVPAAIVNGILPIFGFIGASLYGPNVAIFMVIFFSFAMLKHGLLDVRLLAARVLGFLVVLSVISAAYVLIVNYAIARVFDNDESISLVLQVLSVIVLLFAFDPLKSNLGKITNRIFYRDAYDAQNFIDEVNEILVSNLDIDKLLNSTVSVIEKNLKSSFCSFYIRDTSYYKSRVIGDKQSIINAKSQMFLAQVLPKLQKRAIYVLDDAQNKEEKSIIHFLKQSDADVLVRLVGALDSKVEGIGFLLLGPKKSGNSYTSQDLKILEIISNELVIAIENALRFEEIEQFNVTLQKRIEEATKKLKKSNEKLTALDEAKDEFVSMASHQLRTPLTSVKGYISMVMEGDAGEISEKQKQMLGQAMFSSQRMVYLIADLLNVSRLKTGKFVIEKTPVNLPDVVQSEITQLHEGAAAKNITIAFDRPHKFPTLLLDELKIRQVVMNFVDNALYYTPAGGKINVSLKNRVKTAEFRVKDSGIGVPKTEQHKLFTKFYRAENARKARPDGTGLGLFMAKKVVIAQGGSIIFDSKEGKGSTFGFVFPKEALEVRNRQK